MILKSDIAIFLQPPTLMVRPDAPTANRSQLRMNWAVVTDYEGRRQLRATWQRQQVIEVFTRKGQARLSNLNGSLLIMNNQVERSWRMR
jgi:hypothetical protein